MGLRRPLVLDGSSVSELPSGDWLPDSLGSIVPLTHTGGQIDLDVSTGRMFYFKADDYAPPDITVVAAFDALTPGQGGNRTEPLPAGLLEGDRVVVIINSANLTPDVPGYTNLITTTAGAGTCSVFEKRMGAVPDTTVELRAFYSALIYILRGTDPATLLDAPPVGGAGTASLSIDPQPVTTASFNALVLAAASWLGYGATIASFPAGYTNTTSDISISFSMCLAGALRQLTAPGVEDPGPFVKGGTQTIATSSATLAFRPQPATGEKDYVLNLTGLPAGTFEQIFLMIDVKTTDGGWDLSAINFWAGGVPDLNVVGRHSIEITASTLGTTGFYRGIVT